LLTSLLAFASHRVPEALCSSKGWDGIEHILLIAGVGYVAIVLYIRVLGKRVLSKFDAFDLIITVSLGSAFAGLVTSKESTVSDAVVALGALVMLQWAAGWVSKVIPGMQHLIRSDPSLLFYRGTFLEEVMEREHVNKRGDPCRHAHGRVQQHRRRGSRDHGTRWVALCDPSYREISQRAAGCGADLHECRKREGGVR
jgi:hypothetical protein